MLKSDAGRRSPFAATVNGARNRLVYLGIPCPLFNAGIVSAGSFLLLLSVGAVRVMTLGAFFVHQKHGDNCTYCHGDMEWEYHPDNYRSELKLEVLARRNNSVALLCFHRISK